MRLLTFSNKKLRINEKKSNNYSYMKRDLGPLINLFENIKSINKLLYRSNNSVYNTMSNELKSTFENSFKAFTENESLLIILLNHHNNRVLSGEEIVLFKSHLLTLLLAYREYYRIFIDHIFQMDNDKKIEKRKETYYDKLKEYNPDLKNLDEILRNDVRNRKEHPISIDKNRESHFLYINQTAKYHSQDFNIRIITFNNGGNEQMNEFDIIDITETYAKSLLNALQRTASDFNLPDHYETLFN